MNEQCSIFPQHFSFEYLLFWFSFFKRKLECLAEMLIVKTVGSSEGKKTPTYIPNTLQLFLKVGILYLLDCGYRLSPRSGISSPREGTS